MSKVAGVRFQFGGKLFYCDPGEVMLQAGDRVVVSTEHGRDLAEVVIPESDVGGSGQTEPLFSLVRLAQQEDLDKADPNGENEALYKCQEMATRLGLSMKCLSAHYNLDHSYLVILFGARERVDFRGLVRKLCRSFKRRVELRQVGPRDKARLLGGVGRCGYPLCCQSFLTTFTPVSIKMAKEQGLALNPAKITGVCGRLLCCLGYENGQYAEMKRRMPYVGQKVSTSAGKATVTKLDLLKDIVTVELDDQTTREFLTNQLSWE